MRQRSRLAKRQSNIGNSFVDEKPDGIAPAQAIPNNVDNAAENSVVVHTLDTPRFWKQVLDTLPMLVV